MVEKAGRRSPLLQLQMTVEVDEIRIVFSNICKTRFYLSVVCARDTSTQDNFKISCNSVVVEWAYVIR